jgi:hypothetical protein
VIRSQETLLAHGRGKGPVRGGGIAIESRIDRLGTTESFGFRSRKPESIEQWPKGGFRRWTFDDGRY